MIAIEEDGARVIFQDRHERTRVWLSRNLSGTNSPCFGNLYEPYVRSRYERILADFEG